MKKSLYTLGAVALSFTPALAFAQSTPDAQRANLFSKLTGWINSAIALLFAVATLVFLFGVIQYVIAGGDEKKGATARSYMLYGIIGLAVMAAAWGLVNLLVDTFAGDNTFRNTYVQTFGISGE
jgi:peptidoglycan biosynthesis protein MviN/MurJ (putative lipid II flippase)